jgi:hypothetical protein
MVGLGQSLPVRRRCIGLEGSWCVLLCVDRVQECVKSKGVSDSQAEPSYHVKRGDYEHASIRKGIEAIARVYAAD